MARIAPTVLAGVLAGLTVTPVLAQGQEKGDGSIRVEYQFIHSDRFTTEGENFDYWSTDTHVVMFSGDYALSDRWTIYAALPYVQKRFQSEVPWGGDPHDPNAPYWIDFVPTDTRFIDDGDYHGGLSDISLGVTYTALEGPLTITPYIGYGAPVRDYPFYAKAAIGLQLWKIPVGANFNFVPYFSDWYFDGSVAYVFSEKPLDVNVDYWDVFLEAGYWFRPYLSVNVFTSLKYVREGLEIPWDFVDDPATAVYPEDWANERWYNHDRAMRHRNLNAGLGVDYFPNPRYLLSASWYTGIWADHSNEPAYALTLAVTRFFGDE
jgi:hypothetical protein